MTVRAIAGLLLFDLALVATGLAVLYGLRGLRSWTDALRLAGLAFLIGFCLRGGSADCVDRARDSVRPRDRHGRVPFVVAVGAVLGIVTATAAVRPTPTPAPSSPVRRFGPVRRRVRALLRGVVPGDPARRAVGVGRMALLVDQAEGDLVLRRLRHAVVRRRRAPVPRLPAGPRDDRGVGLRGDGFGRRRHVHPAVVGARARLRRRGRGAPRAESARVAAAAVPPARRRAAQRHGPDRRREGGLGACLSDGGRDGARVPLAGRSAAVAPRGCRGAHGRRHPDEAGGPAPRCLRAACGPRRECPRVARGVASAHRRRTGRIPPRRAVADLARPRRRHQRRAARRLPRVARPAGPRVAVLAARGRGAIQQLSVGRGRAVGAGGRRARPPRRGGPRARLHGVVRRDRGCSRYLGDLGGAGPRDHPGLRSQPGRQAGGAPI